MLNPIICLLKNININNYIILGILDNINTIQYLNDHALVILEESCKNNNINNICVAPQNIARLPYNLTPNIIVIDTPKLILQMTEISLNYQIPLAVVLEYDNWSKMRDIDRVLIQKNAPPHIHYLVFYDKKILSYLPDNNINIMDRNNLFSTLIEISQKVIK